MRKILVIEDNEDIRENLCEILELAGYATYAAENGKIGVEIAEKEHPDLIICDIMMPVLDGFGVLKILSNKATTANIPFVFLTAKTEKGDFRQGMSLGADDYITKPFESKELLEVIELRLKKHERIQKSFTEEAPDLHVFVNEVKAAEALYNLAIDRESRVFKKKDSIYLENTVPRQVYFLNKGKVKIFKTNEDGKELVINIIGESEFFGHLSLLSESNYAESAAALEECQISIVPREDFFTLLHGNRDVSIKFIKILAKNVEEKEQQLIQLAYNSVRKRVADALMTLYNSSKNRTGSATISILREDLASMAGTAKETVIRTLTDFKDEKLINIEEGKIKILNPEKLENMLN